MCYISTQYYLLCGCYGKQAISGDPCIRATTQAGLSNGCWDKIDLGVESVNAACPSCVRGRQESRAFGSRDSSIGASTGGLNVACAFEDVVTEDNGLGATASDTRKPSAADMARALLLSLPSSVKSIVLKGAVLSRKGSAQQSDDESQQTTNLHWRMYNDHAYDQADEG